MGEKTQYDYLKGELDLLNKKKYKLTEKIKNFCQNSEYPLEDRWKLFIESKLGSEEPYYLDFKSVNLGKFLDELDRYSNYSVEDIIFWMEENNYGLEDIHSIKEEILQSFIKLFKYNW